MRTKTLSTSAAILMLSGMPLGIALAQQPAGPRDPGRPNTEQRQTQNRTQSGIQRTRDFVKYDDIKDSRVHNQTGEAIASVADLIVDRGSGEIKHVVVKSGDVLGMGGSEVAIPYSRFNWDAQERRLTLNYTAEQIQNMREFDRDSWKNVLNEDAATDHEAAYQQLQREDDRQRQEDRFQQSLRNKDATELTGTVRRIRTDSRIPGDHTVVTLETREHGLVDVVLAPAWYSMGFSGAPMRGEQVTIRAAEIERHGMNPSPGQPGDQRDRNNPDRNNPDRDNRDWDNPDQNNPNPRNPNPRDPDPNDPAADPRQGDTRIHEVSKTFVARSVRGSRGEVQLRGDDWRPNWDNEPRQPGTTQRGTAGSRYIPFRYVLLEEIIGRDTKGRAEDCGEVQNALIDVGTGHVAFLGVDGGENLLGIGDETYLVPWSIVRVQSNDVVIDSSCSQIKNSTPMPDDLDDLRDDSTWDRLFRNFDTDQPAHYRHDAGNRDWDRDRDQDRDWDRDRDRDRERDNTPMPRR